MPSSADKYIKKFKLNPLPEEGGYFVEFYKSDQKVKSLAIEEYSHYNNGIRSAATTIYFLLEHKEDKKDFSAFHRLKSDEIWHYCDGNPIKIYRINQQGQLISQIVGNPMITVGANFQVIVPAKTWFAAEVMPVNNAIDFGLVTCTVSPGFEFADFELADSEELINQYPQHKEIIMRFTREVSQMHDPKEPHFSI
jgi:predicted cupin superfamily sugar epimerase